MSPFCSSLLAQEEAFKSSGFHHFLVRLFVWLLCDIKRRSPPRPGAFQSLDAFTAHILKYTHTHTHSEHWLQFYCPLCKRGPHYIPTQTRTDKEKEACACMCTCYVWHSIKLTKLLINQTFCVVTIGAVWPQYGEECESGMHESEWATTRMSHFKEAPLQQLLFE